MVKEGSLFMTPSFFMQKIFERIIIQMQINKEVWKVIPDTNGLYEASTYGNIRRVDGKIIKQCIRNNKYKAVCLSIKGKCSMHYVHRLVAKTFIGPNPDGCEVDHIDGDPSNNSLENLRYLTHKTNTSIYSRMKKVSNPILCVNDEKMYLNASEAAKAYDVSNVTIWRNATNGTVTKNGLKFVFVSIEEYEKVALMG